MAVLTTRVKEAAAILAAAKMRLSGSKRKAARDDDDDVEEEKEDNGDGDVGDDDDDGGGGGGLKAPKSQGELGRLGSRSAGVQLDEALPPSALAQHRHADPGSLDPTIKTAVAHRKELQLLGKRAKRVYFTAAEDHLLLLGYEAAIEKTKGANKKVPLASASHRAPPPPPLVPASLPLARAAAHRPPARPPAQTLCRSTAGRTRATARWPACLATRARRWTSRTACAT